MSWTQSINSRDKSADCQAATDVRDGSKAGLRINGPKAYSRLGQPCHGEMLEADSLQRHPACQAYRSHNQTYHRITSYSGLLGRGIQKLNQDSSEAMLLHGVLRVTMLHTSRKIVHLQVVPFCMCG